MRAPKRLGRYEIVRVLGSGAMGVVYEARDGMLQRRVAIKTTCRNDNADEAAARSATFMREAQSIARLNHPNIVTVYDFGEQDDTAYLVMEYIQGHELKHYLDGDARFTLREALGYTIELLNALDYAHAQGMVHRDIKPANIMIDDAGWLKLADFGAAGVLDAADGVQAGMVGTPTYMSPEQILGGVATPRSDIFAAGIICYQLLTWKKPFTGENVFAMQHCVVHEPHAPPSSINSDVTQELDRILARALAKKPEQRYSRAGEFADDIKRFLASQVIHAEAARDKAAPPVACEAAVGGESPRDVTVMSTRLPGNPRGGKLDWHGRSALPKKEYRAPVRSSGMKLALGVLGLIGMLLLLTLGAKLFGTVHTDMTRGFPRDSADAAQAGR